PAEGQKQSAVLNAEGAKQAAILRAEGESQAIATVFQAIHDGKPDQRLLSYQYLQMLPQLAQGDANKIFVIPSEFAEAFGGLSKAFAARAGDATPEVETAGPGDAPPAIEALRPGENSAPPGQ